MRFVGFCWMFGGLKSVVGSASVGEQEIKVVVKFCWACWF